MSDTSTIDTDAIRHALLTELRRLLGRSLDEEEDEEELLSEREIDWEDMAAQQRDAAVLDRLSDADMRRLDEILAALRRLEEGGYGQCRRCGDAIIAERLAAIPETQLCGDCAIDLEHPPPAPPAGR